MTAGTRLAMSVIAMSVIAVSLLAGCAAHRGTSSPAASSSAAAGSPGPTAGASPGATRGVDSGVSGQTMVDGGCPVLRPDSPCPDRPLPARIVVVVADSTAIVASVDTDSDGRFRIPLSPGRYVLQPSNRTGGMLPRTSPVSVTVEAHRYAALSIRFDSGIRGPTT